MAIPTSIRKRDGRIETFDPDKLARSLYAAGESLRSPNAFLARELADGVLHFADSDEVPIETTEQLAELTAKVVRELGHPALARVYLDFEEHGSKRQSRSIVREATVEELDNRCETELAEFSLKHVYPRDLVSAHREGLLQLLDLESPFQVTGMVLRELDATTPFVTNEMLRGARTYVGSFVAIDSPEYALARQKGSSEELAAEFARRLDEAVAETGLLTVINLNVAFPPPSASDSDGPLFAEVRRNADRERVDRIAHHLLDSVKQGRVIWHFSQRDFDDDVAGRMEALGHVLMDRENIELVFDRPRQPIALGPGLDRQRPTLLGNVAIRLVRFVEHLGGGPIDHDLYLRKLNSLARFARSAGHARHDFLRKKGNPRLREGFAIDRAVELLTPTDLMRATQLVVQGNDPTETADLTTRSLQTIRAALDSWSARTISHAVDFPLNLNREVPEVLEMPVRKQLRLIANWQKACGTTLAISLKRKTTLFVKDVPDLLTTAWNTSVRRLRLV